MSCVLITAANTAAAYRLKNSLPGSDVLLGDYMEVPEIMLSSGKILRLPKPSSETYIHDLLALGLDKQLSAVYLLRKEEQDAAANAKQLFDEFEIQLIFAEDEV